MIKNIWASTQDFGTYHIRQAAKAQTRLHICTVWSEPSLLVYGCRGRLRPNFRPVMPAGLSA